MADIKTSASPLGGQTYPFLERLGTNAWAIHSNHITDLPETPGILRWVNDTHVLDVYIEGYTTTTLLEQLGLELDMGKGGFVMSKRLSRIMRPYFISGFFDPAEVRIRYMDELDDVGLKTWDGAGLMSRAMAERLIAHLPENLPRRRRKQLIHELKHDQRFEFTIMTGRGQDKGHAIVVDNLADTIGADFVLPRDTKDQVRLVDGTMFIGLYGVHGSDNVRLDVQSLINLHPFFKHEQLVQWLQDEADLFFESVESGEIGEMMSRIDPVDTTLAGVQQWHIREYLVSGGHPMWFGHTGKSLINQHLKRLKHTALRKLRLPFPGGRYYVMVDTIGGKPVPRGQVRLDPEAATAWVNHEDWVEFAADVWGGADQDDALWCYPFSDEADGNVYFLLWRSPNQLGEYVVLRPTPDCYIPNHEPGAPHNQYNDSRLLPPRIDQVEVNYLNLVDESSAGGLGEGQLYSVPLMDLTIQRTRQNRGALGFYCNLLMVAKGVYGCLPKQPPAPLEDVIDGSVKTGTNLKPVITWCENAAKAVRQKRTPIPRFLEDRLGKEQDDSLPPIVYTENHWLDTLVNAVLAHIESVKMRRDELIKTARPPQVIFDSAISGGHLAAGGTLNSTYTLALNQRKTEVPQPADYERAREACEQRLAETPDLVSETLAGAIASYYLAEDHRGNCAAVWQYGAEHPEGGRQPGIAQQTLRALRDLGVIDELDDTIYGLMAYPTAQVPAQPARTIALNGVWFNWHRAVCQHRGQAVPNQMRDVPRPTANQAKQQLATLSQAGRLLTIRQEGDRKLAYTEQGSLYGYVSKSCADSVPTGTITLCEMTAYDGNLRGTFIVPPGTYQIAG